MLKPILNHMYHCVRCEKSWGDFDWLCPECEYWWHLKISHKQQWITSEIRHHYLIDWELGNELSSIVHSLKGGGRLKIFKELVPFFPHIINKGPFFYPSSGGRDHAWELAEACARYHNRSIEPIFKRSKAKQALLSKRERKQNPLFLSHSKCREAILVDDIVTTGNTALACWRALGRPRKMTVWSLFYRKSL